MFGANVEIFGGDTEVGFPISAMMRMYYNNYRGFGYSRELGLSAMLAGKYGINASVTNDSKNAGLIGNAGIS